MKLILTTDVPGLGGPGDIVEVRDGYGRNFLLPQGRAIGATKGAEKQVEIYRQTGDLRVSQLDDHPLSASELGDVHREETALDPRGQRAEWLERWTFVRLHDDGTRSTARQARHPTRDLSAQSSWSTP